MFNCFGPLESGDLVDLVCLVHLVDLGHSCGQALHLGMIVRFFNSIHIRGCKITSAVNDPYNVL
jgi:hypothetical protein